MRKSFLFLFAVSVLISTAGQAAAQTPPPAHPPNVLSIFREEVKPAKGAAHERVEAAYVKAFRDAKWKTYYLAMTSITGPSEAWFVNAYDSYDAWQKDTDAVDKNPTLRAALDQADDQDAALRTGQRALVARYREDLSYNADVNIAQMRYFQVATYRVRPGHTRSFEDARKITKAAHEKAGVNEHYAIFQVTSGMPGGTFLLFIPRKSLNEMDTDPHTKAYQDALGDDNRMKIDKMTSDDVQVVETAIFAISPRMSYVAEEMASVDPSFWKPKPMKPKPAAPKKPEAAKPPAN